MKSKKTPPKVVDRKAQQALDLFERGMKALGKRDYDRAYKYLDELIEEHPEERDLLERARAYRTLCERSMGKRPTFRPKGFDDLLHHGIYLHNKGDFEDALKVFRQAAQIHPKNEHVLYCLAATAARSGDTHGALQSLRAAVAASPANRTQARTDSDFDGMRHVEDFVSILQSPSI